MKQDSVKQGVVNDVIKFMQKNSVESFELTFNLRVNERLWALNSIGSEDL